MGDAICLVEACGYPVQVKGYCGAHYRRHRLGKDLDAPMRRRRSTNVGACSVDGCDQPRSYKTLCVMHYSRQRRHGDVDRGHRRQACKDPGCQSPAAARGWCASCYQRELYRGSFDKPECSIPGCYNRVRTKGLCGLHYARQRRGIDATAPMRRERGTGSPDRSGYVRAVRADGSLVLQHRLVMELILGRPLDPRENVHHINGIRHDNRPENLELWVKPQPNGQRVSDLVQWVVDHYREEVISLLAQ